MASRPSTFSTPLGAASDGHLEFARGASRVTIVGADGTTDLASLRFEGTAPMVFADDGRLTIEYPRVSPSEWLRPNRRAVAVTLNSSLPWELVFSGGVSRLRGDLATLALRSLEIRRGANEVEIDLPEPRGIVSVRIRGGANKVTLRRPTGVPLALVVAGGVSTLTFDDESWGSTGGPMRLASPGAAESPNRYEVEVGGGASRLSIAEVR
jgi:hypothetical protein